MAKLHLYVRDDWRDSSPIDIARDYIMAGVPVFPCRNRVAEDVDMNTGELVVFKEKTPLTSNGLNGASRTPRIIDIQFGDRHPDALIGVPTGSKSGFWVLDIDRHGDRDGHLWLSEMESIHGPMPPTARASTANGGTHIFFRHVDGVRNRASIAPGVDTRGEGGYIIAPGSVMADGRRYDWIDHIGPGIPAISDAPSWLMDMVIARARDSVPAPAHPSEYRYTPGDNAAYVERAVEAELSRAASAPVGSRGQQLFASACALGEFVAAGALRRSHAEDALYDAARASGLLAKDGDRETRNRIRRGLDKTQSSPRDIPAPPDYAPEIDAVRLVENTLRKRAEALLDDAPANDDVPQAPRTRSERPRFDITWFDEIEEGAPKETIIKGAFGVAEFTTVSGLPGTGKSVIVTDAACHVAAGMDWHGKRVRQGLVVYVAAERKKLTERRMMAFRKRYKVKDVPLMVVAGRMDFTTSLKDAKELVALVREAETQAGMKCVWIIIDTLTRVFGPGDQNASKDMTRFVQSCDEILVETQAHVTAIHHSAWTGERGKGAIDLDGAVDASFMVKKEHGRYKLICDGTNDGEDGEVLAFTMDSVEVGVDEDGEPTTAPVVRVADNITADTLRPSQEKVSGQRAKALEILHSLIASQGVIPSGPGYPDGVMVVGVEDWKNAVCDDYGPGVSDGTRRSNWSRARNALVDGGIVKVIGKWVFPT